MTGAVTYMITLFLVFLTPVLVYLDIFTRPLTMLAVIPITPIALAAVITSFAKVPGSNGDYKTIWARMVRGLLVTPISCLMAMGMMVFETYAILDGLFSNDATFLRTPKEGTAAATAASAEGHTTSIVDYMKEEEDESSGSGNNQVVEASAAGINTKLEQNRCCIHSKFIKDLFLGLMGLLLVAYFVVWGTVLFLLMPREYSLWGLAQRSFVLAPIPGLLYFHLSFVVALLGSSFSKLLSKEKKSPSLRTIAIGTSLRTIAIGTSNNPPVASERDGLSSSSDEVGIPEKKEA
jgi:hypothetical protein